MIMLVTRTGGNFARLGHNTSGGTNMLDVRSEGHIRFLTSGNNERVRMVSGGQVLVGATASLSFNGVGQHHNLVVAGGSSDTDITITTTLQSRYLTQMELQIILQVFILQEKILMALLITLVLRSCSVQKQ